MSDVSNIAKILIVLGVLSLVAGAMPGMPTNTAWSDLEATLSAGPNLPASPEFGNPYTLSTQYVDLSPASNGTYLPVNAIGTGNGCNVTTYPFNTSSPDWWRCVGSEDANASYLQITGASFEASRFSVTLDNFTVSVPTNGNIHLLSATLTYQCKADGAGPVTTLFRLLFTTGPRSGSEMNAGESTSACGLSDWTTYTITADYSPGLNVSLIDPNELSGSELVVALDDTVSTWYSYVHVQIAYAVFQFTDRDCQADFPADAIGQFACTVDQGIHWFGDFVLFLASGALFLIQYGAALLLYFFGLISGFVLGIVVSFTFFFSIPGAPPIVQGLMDIILIGMIGYVALTILRLLRGGG